MPYCEVVVNGVRVVNGGFESYAFGIWLAAKNNGDTATMTVDGFVFWEC